MGWEETLITHSWTRSEHVSSWAPLSSALGLRQLLAVELGSGMAAAAPPAKASGTEPSRDTHTEHRGDLTAASSKGREGRRAQLLAARCSRRQRPRWNLHEEPRPLDGNDRSRMAEIPAQRLCVLSPGKSKTCPATCMPSTRVFSAPTICCAVLRADRPTHVKFHGYMMCVTVIGSAALFRTVCIVAASLGSSCTYWIALIKQVTTDKRKEEDPSLSHLTCS